MTNFAEVSLRKRITQVRQKSFLHVFSQYPKCAPNFQEHLTTHMYLSGEITAHATVHKAWHIPIHCKVPFRNY
jgi:hypothetical protein